MLHSDVNRCEAPLTYIAEYELQKNVTFRPRLYTRFYTRLCTYTPITFEPS